MLVRQDGRGVLVIGQPFHAWISGQLARAGNERFGSVDPYEEVCLAAEQHDIGMAISDLDPARNPDTELPASFMQMAIPQHIELWDGGAAAVAATEPVRRAARFAARGRGSTRGVTSARCPALRLRWCASSSRVSAASSTSCSRRCDGSADRGVGDRPAGRAEQPPDRHVDALSLAICLDYAPYTVTDVPTATGPGIDLGLTAGGRHD